MAGAKSLKPALGLDWMALPASRDGRIWAPDAFAWLWDRLDQDQSWRASSPERIASEAVRWRDAIRTSDRLGYLPGYLPNEVDIASLGNEAAVRLRLLVAIDHAFEGLALSSMPTPPLRATEPLLKAWRHSGSLQSPGVPGLVLRKPTTRHPGSSLAQFCWNMLRVPEPMASRIRVKPGARGLGPWIAANRVADRPTQVAFLPVLTAEPDLKLIPHEREGEALFGLALEPAAQAAAVAGVASWVGHLEADGVSVALLPESATSEELFKELRLRLAENAARARAAGRRPDLGLILVGLAGPRSNVAVLLNGAGREEHRQLKIQGWQLDLAQQERGCLVDELKPGIDRREDIDEQPLLTVLDDPTLGRIVLLICEDLYRIDPSRTLVGAVGASLVFGPVLDASLRKTGWAFRAAQALAAEPGSLVLIANSAVLNAKRRARTTTAQPCTFERDPGVGIVHPPSAVRPGRVICFTGTEAFACGEIQPDEFP